MRVSRFEMHGFKAFESADVPLAPLTLIVGANGSGKTSVLQAFELLSGLVRSSIRDILERRGWEYADLPHLKTKGKSFGFEVEFDEPGLSWSLELGHKRGPGVAAERVKARSSDGERILLERVWREMKRRDASSADVEFESIIQTLTQSWLSAVNEEDSERFPELLAIASWARRVAGYLELQPAALRESSRMTQAGAGRDGRNLAGFLAYLKKSHPERFERVIDGVRTVYPRLVSIDVRSARAGWNRLEVVERWGAKRLSFHAQQVSDGLLRLLAIASFAEMPEPHSLLMIDEVENGLHPHLLGAVVKLLEKLADAGTQVVATTHSPIALNYVESPDQVLIASRAVDGSASLTPLSASSAFSKVRSVLDPGEAWYNLGEEQLLAAKVSERRKPR